MTNINPNDGVNKINANINKEKKVNKKKEAIAKTKQVEASALNALNSYGKASINFKGNIKEPTPLTQEVIDSRIKTLTDIGFDYSIAKDVALFDDTKNYRFLTLLEQEIPDYVAKDVALYDDTQYYRFKIFIDKGFDYSIAKDVALYDDTQLSRFLSLCKQKVPCLKAKNVALYDDTQYSRFKNLIDKGVDVSHAEKALSYDDAEFSHFKSLIDKGIVDSSAELLMQNKSLEKKVLDYIANNDTKGYKIAVSMLRTNWDSKLTLTKENKTNDTKIKIEKNIILSKDIEYSTRTETYKDGTIHTYNKNSDRVLDITKNNNNELVNQIEIINDTNGEPYEIIHTKASEELDGAFETTKYTLSDYPEDMDILKAIQDGTITGGQKLSTITKNANGSTSYKEAYEYNNCLTTRDYNILKDKNGKKLSESYKYSITEKNGNILLNIDRSFTQNSDGSTETIINGKKYITTFDDGNMIITIKNSNGEETEIDFAKKLKRETKENREVLWNFFKECPADTLLILKRIQKINKVDILESAYCLFDEGLKIGTNQNVMNHELGHLIDYNSLDKIDMRPEGEKIYNEEMALFQKQYPTEFESFIRYFAPDGGSLASNGLNEFFAETNMLLHNYGHDIEGIKTRTMMLTKYFPKTIAKIGQLLYGQQEDPTLYYFQLIL